MENKEEEVKMLIRENFNTRTERRENGREKEKRKKGLGKKEIEEWEN